MKNLLLTLTVALGLTVAYGQSTNYHPFPDTNAHWCETAWWTVWTPSPCVVTDVYCLFINGDTVIGTNTYHKIYQSGYIGATCPPPGYNYYNDYKGALRQDSLLKKVFFVPVTNSNESLLYDFNLNVGDTLASSYNGGNSNKVIGIDSVLVGSNYHKRFLLTPLNPISSPDTNYAIIECVGSTYGLYNMIVPPFESGSQLNCFAHNGQFYPTTSNCPFTVGVTEKDNDKFEIKIFPNPFSSLTVLQTDNLFKNATLTVCNLFGQTVKQIKNISGQTIIFQRDNLSSGLYFIRLTQDNKILSVGKLVITDN
jgi:hypothetical protein